jgi:hydrogenase maturation protease
MNRDLVSRIANAVLYEGYVLYPYRPSVKNRQRWTFGVLYPPARSEVDESDPVQNQTECLVQGSAATRLSVTVRFLHLVARTAGRVDPPLTQWPAKGEPPFCPVETLRAGDATYHTWQEAEEREVVLGERALGELTTTPVRQPFAVSGRRLLEPVSTPTGETVGVLERRQQTVEGVLEVSATPVSDGLFRVTLRVMNRTAMAAADATTRDAALLRSMASTHAVLEVRDGAFVSLLDPPGCWREAAAACQNVGTWPVLVGAEGERDAMLSAPIILYDYPQVAPESPGDFFDGAEIDEMLSLRVLTMTDEEKRAMAAVDGRTATLLARTEAMAREQLLGLHGTFRPAGPEKKGAEGG